MNQTTTNIDSTPLPGIAKKLVSLNLLKKPEAKEIAQRARQENKSFYLYVIEQDKVSFCDIAPLASEVFGLPCMQLDVLSDNDNEIEDILHPRLMAKHHVLPMFKRNQDLYVGIAEPCNKACLDEIKFATQMDIKFVLVEPRKLNRALNDLINPENAVSLKGVITQQALDDIDLSDELNGVSKELDLNLDTPLVRFVDTVLQQAIERNASDIHIESYETNARIRYRIDGVMYEVLNPMKLLANKMIARLKILSSLDIAEKRLPQDGRMKMTLTGKGAIDCRVSTMPTLFGEKMVIRILDTDSANLQIDTIGMTDSQLALYTEVARKPHGLILVTGPTGSGKTVSLYSALNMLNSPQRNISSVEDPVEVYVDGINQVNVNEKAGLTFSRTLRAFLRQDPDVIMVGEIRDLETAEVSIKASQTGHLVLSTLHTNDAPSSVTRLLNMGVAPFNVASSVSLVIAQRLVRKLCIACREPTKYSKPTLDKLGFKAPQFNSLKIYKAMGCSSCIRGYSGRTGIFEVMPVTPAIAEIIMSSGSARDIAKQAAVDTMRQSGLAKVAAGITTIEEVERVTTY